MQTMRHEITITGAAVLFRFSLPVGILCVILFMHRAALEKVLVWSPQAFACVCNIP